MEIEKFKEEWKEKIKNSLWYLDIQEVLKNLQELKGENKDKYEETKENLLDFFEEALNKKEVFLGKEGKNFDSERKNIDTIIIHHTHNKPGITPSRLSAMILLRLYSTYFANPTHRNDKEIKGKPIYSGHFRDGNQVFYPYHWIVRNDGKAERLLNDEEIGWQSGDWDVNCRSVAIVLDNNYEKSEPTEKELQSITDIIKENYKSVSKENIIGHREVNKKTTCPSNLFLGDNGWKNKLLDLLTENR